MKVYVENRHSFTVGDKTYAGDLDRRNESQAIEMSEEAIRHHMTAGIRFRPADSRRTLPEAKPDTTTAATTAE